jgi:hypothetical protein
MSANPVNGKPAVGAPRPRAVLRAISIGTIVAFVILVLTGIVPLMMGKHVGGFALLVHVGMGGFFAFCLTLLVIAFSSHYAFDTPASCVVPPVRKVLFWLFAAGGLSLILSAVLMMIPLFGSPGQATLVAWHRWTSYFEVLVAVLYGLSLLTGRRRA